MSNKFDDVSLCAAYTTIKDLFADIDGEAVVAATHRTWTELLRTDAFECDATPGDFIFDPYGAGAPNIGGGDHAGFQRSVVCFLSKRPMRIWRLVPFG
jgi:hypothetical protein